MDPIARACCRNGSRRASVRDRRRPGELLRASAGGVEIAGDFRGRRRRQSADTERPDHGVDPAACGNRRRLSKAAPLHGICSFQEKLNLLRRVACHVRRTLPSCQLSAPRASLRRVGHVQVLRRVARVQVREDAGNRAVLSLVPSRDEVPERVLLERSPESGVEIPLLDQRSWRPQPRGPEPVGVVAADPSARNARQVGGSL